MWFQSVADIVRVLVLGLASYAALILALRLAGKRALSQLNAFDWLVSVALGSILASTIVSDQINFSEGAAGIAILLFLQAALTFGSVRIGWLRRMIRSEPAVLVRSGQFDDAAMRRCRVTYEEIEEAIRRAGIGRIVDVAAVVIETDGSFSVIRDEGSGSYDLVGSIDRRNRRLATDAGKP